MCKGLLNLLRWHVIEYSILTFRTCVVGSGQIDDGDDASDNGSVTKPQRPNGAAPTSILVHAQSGQATASTTARDACSSDEARGSSEEDSGTSELCQEHYPAAVVSSKGASSLAMLKQVSMPFALPRTMLREASVTCCAVVAVSHINPALIVMFCNDFFLCLRL